MKHNCPVCQTEYVHQRRLITHLAKTNCGVVAGRLGLQLDIDKRNLRGIDLEKKKANTKNDKEAEPQTTVAVDVAANQPEPDTNDSDDNDVQPKPKSRKRKIEETLDCPECGTTIRFSRTPETLEGVVTCKTCNSVWEWEA